MAGVAVAHLHARTMVVAVACRGVALAHLHARPMVAVACQGCSASLPTGL